MELCTGIARAIFLEDETLEMGHEVQINMAFPRDNEMALARLGTVS